MTSAVVGLRKLGNKKETRNQRVAPQTLARIFKHRAIGATNVIAIGPLFKLVSTAIAIQKPNLQHRIQR